MPLSTLTSPPHSIPLLLRLLHLGPILKPLHGFPARQPSPSSTAQAGSSSKAPG